MNVGSLFSGIGGIDLGLERAGMQVIWQSEVDPFASRVLARHWPTVPNLGDIKRIDWDTIERPDVVAGGFPCQPVSVAGLRRGQADERWLWPEFARCLRVLRPDWAVMENVPGLLLRGMGDVLGDLAALGYDAEWDSVPAKAVGAPHLRWRIFIVAYPRRSGPQGLHEASGRIDLQPAPTDLRRQWRSEPDVARVANGLPCRLVDRIPRTKGLGNAVVPQVAEWIGRCILRCISNPPESGPRLHRYDGSGAGGSMGEC